MTGTSQIIVPHIETVVVSYWYTKSALCKLHRADIFTVSAENLSHKAFRW